MEAEKNKNYFSNFRDNPWILSTVVLAVILIGFIFFTTTGSITGNVVSKDVAADNLLSFIESQGQAGSVQVVSTEMESGLYKITLDYQGQDVPVYVSSDGNYLITDLIPLSADFLEQLLGI